MDVSNFLSGDHSDINIDAFFSTLRKDNALTISSSWFEACVGEGKSNKAEGKSTWFDKDFVFIPMNISNYHWILTAILPKQLRVYYLDPLGSHPNLEVVERLCTFLNDRRLLETFEIDDQVWKIEDLMKTNVFPRQSDVVSCGAFVCLYGKMLEKDAVLTEHYTVDQMRQFILHEVITAYSNESKESKIFGLANVIFTKDLDDIVHAIVTGEQSCNTVHEAFLKSPEAIHRKKLCNFAMDYVSEDVYYEVSLYLLDNYFRSTSGLFKLDIRKCVFSEAENLNRRLRENMQYASWYVDFVLVKGVIVECLRRQLNLSIEEMWQLCSATEFSKTEEISNKIRGMRETRRKDKADVPRQ